MALIKTTSLLIDRDASNKTPTTVFDYEVPILEAIHGGIDTGLVYPFDHGVANVAIEDPMTLLEGLRNKYSAKPSRAALDRIYPDLSSFNRALARATVEEAEEAPDAEQADAAAELAAQRAELEAERAELEKLRKEATKPAPAKAKDPPAAKDDTTQQPPQA